MMFTYTAFEERKTLSGQSLSKIEHGQFKFKFSIQNSITNFSISDFDQKYTLQTNLVQKTISVSLS